MPVTTLRAVDVVCRRRPDGCRSPVPPRSGVIAAATKMIVFRYALSSSKFRCRRRPFRMSVPGFSCTSPRRSDVVPAGNLTRAYLRHARPSFQADNRLPNPPNQVRSDGPPPLGGVSLADNTLHPACQCAPASREPGMSIARAPRFSECQICRCRPSSRFHLSPSRPTKQIIPAHPPHASVSVAAATGPVSLPSSR